MVIVGRDHVDPHELIMHRQHRFKLESYFLHAYYGPLFTLIFSEFDFVAFSNVPYNFLLNASLQPEHVRL